MDRRSEYLRIAVRLFAKHGFVGTTMDMIVGEAGGSKATLYKHFPSKESLIAGLMDDVVASIRTQTLPAGVGEMPLREALTAIGRVVLAAVGSEQAIAVFRLCLGEYGRFPELARVVWDHGPAVTYANFHRFLEDRRDRGEVEYDDVQFASEQFIAGIVGHLQPKIAMGIAEPPSEEESALRVASAVETFMARYARGAARDEAALLRAEE